jgi:hypothetical protein
MNLNELTENERLVAEQAVLAYQVVRQTAGSAPEGHGMELVEQTVRDKGFDLLRRMIELGASEHPEAQKKGSAAKLAPAAKR